MNNISNMVNNNNFQYNEQNQNNNDNNNQNLYSNNYGNNGMNVSFEENNKEMNEKKINENFVDRNEEMYQRNSYIIDELYQNSPFFQNFENSYHNIILLYQLLCQNMEFPQFFLSIINKNNFSMIDEGIRKVIEDKGYDPNDFINIL